MFCHGTGARACGAGLRGKCVRSHRSDWRRTLASMNQLSAITVLCLSMGCTSIYYVDSAELDAAAGSDASVDSTANPCALVDGYVDRDGDGFGSGTVRRGCVGTLVALATDCNDLCPTCYPRAQEVCDGLDNDCDAVADNACTEPVDTELVDAGASDARVDDRSDVSVPVDPRFDAGVVDSGCQRVTWYADRDRDGFGDPQTQTSACSAPQGYVGRAQDCDDFCATCNPGRTELCGDGRDNNCASGVDENCNACSGVLGQECGGAICCGVTLGGQEMSCRSIGGTGAFCCLEGNARCDSNLDCCGDMLCTNRRCVLREIGESCRTPADCASGFCSAGTCRRQSPCDSIASCGSCLAITECDWCTLLTSDIGSCKSSCIPLLERQNRVCM